MMDIASVELPARAHATVLTGRDVVSGEDLHEVIVWVDRAYDQCPTCDQTTGREVTDCPVLLDAGAGQGGVLLDIDQTHGCGQWLSVSYRAVAPAKELDPDDSDPDDPDSIDLAAETSQHVAPGVAAIAVIAAAEELLGGLDEELAAARKTIERDLRRDLDAALTRLAEPLADDEDPDDRADEVSTGSETEPGVYRDDNGVWQAWEYDPAGGEGDSITVFAKDGATASSVG